MGYQFEAKIINNETDIEKSYLVDYDKFDRCNGFFGDDGGYPPEPEHIEINWIKNLDNKEYADLTIEEEKEILEQAEHDYYTKENGSQLLLAKA